MGRKIEYHISQLKTFAKDHQSQGKCLSIKYRGSKFKYRWECNYGHKWKSSWDNIRRGSWCPKCAENKKYQKSDINTWLYENNKQGNLAIGIPNDYINSQSPLIWFCRIHSRNWKATWNNILHKGSWCPRCAKKSKKSK